MRPKREDHLNAYKPENFRKLDDPVAVICSAEHAVPVFCFWGS